MALNAQDPAALALLIERVEDLGKKMDGFNALALMVNTHAVHIEEMKKDSSGNHKAVESVKDFAATTRGGIKVLYAVMLIFTGLMGTGTGVAIGLFFKDSQNISRLDATVQDLRNDVNMLLGERK